MTNFFCNIIAKLYLKVHIEMKPDVLGQCQLPTMHNYVHLQSEAQQKMFPYVVKYFTFSYHLQKLMVQ